MCRLFGLVANKEVDVEFSLLKTKKSFKTLGSLNPDGWGIGYYKNHIPEIFKEPISVNASQHFDNIIKHTHSNIIISHVRKSTQGKKKEENTHPFKYENWIFAHNGNLDIKNLIKSELSQKYYKHIKGETDSEIFFYLLMQNIKQNDDVIDGIKETLKFIESNKGKGTTSLNFLLTNGKKIFILRKAFSNENYYSLFYLNRNPRNINELKYTSEQTKLFILSKRLSSEKAVIFCSEKLSSDEEWIPLSNGDLMIVDNDLVINIENL